ncbi:MAG: small, acid-soluble spore protein, alpha/beta type [Clostridiales bacterium]|nr:small, acid-soluble spore protein, alpha/beta type [Clostridiales bacterium]
MNPKEPLLSGALRRSALSYLSEQEKRKYEIARELGILDKVRQVGWAGLSAKETGRIGGLMGRKHHTSKGD